MSVHLLLQVLNNSLGRFNFGYCTNYLNISMETLNYVLSIDHHKSFYNGFLTFMIPIGAIIGVYLY